MAVLFNKSPTRVAAATTLLVGLIMCSILMTVVSAQQVSSVGSPGVAPSPAEYQEFEMGMPLYRIKEKPNVLIPETILANEDYPSIAAAPSSLFPPSPTPSPSPL